MSDTMIVIDAANVIGSRPDGWWRDRPGAARRFVERLGEATSAGRIDGPVTVVLEGRFRAGVAEGDIADVAVRHASGEGDDAIVDEVAELAVQRRKVLVVTADRGLADRVRGIDAEVVGPSWLFSRLGP